MKILSAVFVFNLLLAINILADNYTEISYHEQNSNKSIKFILPPQAELLSNDKLKTNYRFQFVHIDELSLDYLKSLNLINENGVNYYHNKNGISNYGFSYDDSPIASFYEIKDDKVPDDEQSKGIVNKGIELRINYERFFELTRGKTKKETISIFNNMAISVITKLSEKENGNNFQRAPSLCQNILEKIFESIPIPQESSLSRFGFISDDNRVILLLNPKIKLKIDTTIRIDKGGFNFQDQFLGQALFSFYRKQDPESMKVDIVQSPFKSITKGNYPSNTIGENSQLTLLSTSGDIQLSKSLNSQNFIAYYEGNVRANNRFDPPTTKNVQGKPDEVTVKNSIETDPCQDPNNICAQNSYLLFSDTLSDFYEENPDTNFPPQKPQKAIFGERNLISPQFSISIKRSEKKEFLDHLNPFGTSDTKEWFDFLVPIGTTISDLQLSGLVLKNYKLERIYNGELKDFEKASPETILLPGDLIKYK